MGPEDKGYWTDPESIVKSLYARMEYYFSEMHGELFSDDILVDLLDFCPVRVS
jgi:hypothetical protein